MKVTRANVKREGAGEAVLTQGRACAAIGFLAAVNIAEDLQAAAKAFPSVSIGSYPRFGDARCPVMVSIEGRVEADVQACMQRLLPQLQAHTTVEACHAAAAAAGVSESRSSRL